MNKVTTAAAIAVLLAATAEVRAADVFGRGAAEDAAAAQRLSREHVVALARRNGVAERDLVSRRVDVDVQKMAHNRLQQTVRGVPVWGGEAIVHLRGDGSLFAVTDTLVPNVRVADTQPRVSADGAADLAIAAYGCRDCLTAKPVTDLWVLRVGQRDHLAYRVQLRREDGTDRTAMPVFFVDAMSGRVVKRYENLQTGTGSSLYSGTVTIGTSVSGSTYYMEDTTKKIGTFDNRNTPSTNTGAGSTYRFTNTSDSWTTSTQRAGVDAQYGATATYDYYKAVHGRNGIDGSGGPGYYTAAANSAVGLITSKVHYGSRYNNAYWNGSFMTYGDGDGTTFTPLVTLDIAGHEMTHGVTERTAGLVYEREPGALNESMSDVFGAMVERYKKGESANTWKIGEDAYTPSTAGDALRFMDNPPAAGDPDHYSEAVYLSASVCDNTNDSCGVHTNSGIPNKVFYLVAKGGVHPNTPSVTITGLGADAAASIWYRALTSYMTSSTTFSGARTATLNAASAIYGSTSSQYTAVCQAWYAAGVGAACGSGGGGGTELLVNGGFNTSTSSWVAGTSILYSASGGQSAGYVSNSNVNSLAANNTIYQQVAIPSTATGTLTFYTYITTQESSTDTTAWDKLFVEVRNTSGTLLATPATYSNLNPSTGWVARSVSLAAYKGQTVRVQFRVTTDGSLPTVFRVDTVSLK